LDEGHHFVCLSARIYFRLGFRVRQRFRRS